MNKYLLYNLAESINVQQIKKIVHSLDNDDVSRSEVRKTITDKVIKDIIMDRIDFLKRPFSILVLNEFDIPPFTIEEIQKHYLFFESFIDALKQEKENFPMPLSIYNNIKEGAPLIAKDFILPERDKREFNKTKTLDKKQQKKENKSEDNELYNLVLNIIKDHGKCISIKQVGLKLHLNRKFFRTEELRDIIKQMERNRDIKKTYNGYSFLHPDIDSYLESHTSVLINMYKEYLHNNTSDCYISLGLKKNDFIRKINSIIPYLPIFKNEINMYDLLQLYNIPYEAVNPTQFSKTLYYHVKKKYQLNPRYDIIHYVMTYRLFNISSINKLLAMKKVFISNEKIIPISFENLLYDFISESHNKYTKVSDFESFINYTRAKLGNVSQNTRTIPTNSDKFKFLLEHSENIVNNNGNYYYIKQTDFPSELWDILLQLIIDIEGYESISHFYRRNSDFFETYGVDNKHYAYAILKLVIKNCNSHSISDNIIIKNDIDKKLWLTDMRIEYDIESKKQLFLLLESNYGLGNCFIDKFLGKEIHSISNNELSIKTLPKKIMEKFEEFIIPGFFSVESVDDFISNNGYDGYSTKDFINERVLNDFNLKKDGTIVFKRTFISSEDAVLNYINVYPSDLIRISELIGLLGNRKYKEYYEKLSRELVIIKISENYLFRTNKSSKSELLLLKETIINRMDPSIIYTLNDIYEFKEFRKLKHLKTVETCLGIGDEILIELLRSSSKVSHKKTAKNLFRLLGKISKKEIIKIIMSEVNSYIYLTELHDIIETEYGYFATIDVLPYINELKYVYKVDSGIIFLNNEEFYKFMGGNINGTK